LCVPYGMRNIVIPCVALLMLTPCLDAGESARSASGPSTRPAADPATASLANAIEDWVTLIERDELKSAQARWTRDAAAARELSELWERVKAAHKRHDYRNWLDDARQIDDARTFKVGGHDVDHLHIDWERTAAGWRIAKVWGCR